MTIHKIELRYDKPTGDDLDEVVVSVGDGCVTHIEMLCDSTAYVGLGADGNEARLTIHAYVDIEEDNEGKRVAVAKLRITRQEQTGAVVETRPREG